MTYESSPTTQRSRLTRVKECADGTENNCLLPTVFTYQAGLSGVNPGTAVPPPGSSFGFFPGRYDFNGDGKEDLLYSLAGMCHAVFGANSGFTGPFSVGRSSCGAVGRYLPNGRDAMAFAGSPVTIVRWDDASSTFAAVNMGFNLSGGSIVPADYDGDGLTDLIVRRPNNIQVHRNTSTGSGNPSLASSGLTTHQLFDPMLAYDTMLRYGGAIRTIDFNGDRREDLFLRTVRTISGGSGTTFTASVLSWGGSGGFAQEDLVPFLTLNFNGDGCLDRYYNTQVDISPCVGVPPSTVATPGTPVLTLDWDGDGKSDVLVNSGGTLSVYLSTGNGFSSPIATTISATGPFFAMDLDGDRLDDIVKTNGSGAISYWTHTTAGQVPTPGAFATNIPDLLSSVTDGLGVNQLPEYVSTAWRNYVADGPATFPLQEAEPRIVVAQVTHSGNTGTFKKTYFYRGARQHAPRGSFAGFQRVEETDERNGIVTKTYFDQDFPRTGRVKQRDVLQPDGTLIARTEFINTSVVLDPAQYNERHFVYTSRVTETRNEIASKNGQTVSTRVTNFTNVDAANGNIRTIETVVTDTDFNAPQSPTAGATWTQTTQMFFSPDSANWCLGVPTQRLVTQSSTASGSGSAVTRRVDFDVDYPKCRVFRSTVAPGTGYQAQTTFEFDDDPGNPLPDFGNVTKVTVAGAGVPARSSSMTWTATGQFPDTSKNALDQQSSFGYDFARGVRTSETDPNGLVTSFTYDAFARPTKTVRADGTASQVRRVDCATYANYCSSAIRGLIFYEELDTNQSVIRFEDDVIDKFGRVIQSWTKSLNTSSSELYSMVNIAYDPLGRIASQSAPCLTANCGTQHLTQYSYDLLGRPISISRPVSSSNPSQHLIEFDYRGAFTEIRDGNQKARRSYTDPNGLLRRNHDHNYYGQDFTYDAAGSLLSVTDSNGTPLLYGVQYAYGLEAYQTHATDADMGPRTQTYNALGELLGWTDAKGQGFQATFDALSRPLSRTEPDQKTFWVWGAAADNTASAKFIGRLRDVRTETLGGAQTYRDIYGFDAKGRLSQHTVSIPGEGAFTYDYAYHATLGLLESMQFPSTVGTRPKLSYEYRYGKLLKVTNGASTPTVYWEAKKSNELHAVTEEALGNNLSTKRSIDAVSGALDWIRTGVTGSGNDTSIQNLSYLYDKVGNVTQRQSGLLGLTENFYYDDIHRLDYSHVPGQPNPTVDYSYQANGNLETNTALGGTYNYSTAQAGCSNYAHAQPHAVRSIGSTIYCYDANGNMISRGGSSINWTSYNYPSQVNSNGQSAQFSYGPDRQRWKMVFNDGTNTETTHYIGGALEKVVSPTLGTVYRHTISAAGAPVAILTRTSSGVDTLRYVLSDHQGSIETLTTSSGAFEARESFSAFGTRRNADTWAGGLPTANGAALDAVTRQGYTYQTVLGAMGLTHMNGRVQDALSGRFISADPYIPNPADPQSYNRYSYVSNNPLSFTDPSGFTDNPIGCTPYPWDNRSGSGGLEYEFYNSVVIAARCDSIHPGTPGVAFPTWGPHNGPTPYGGGPATTGGAEGWQCVRPDLVFRPVRVRGGFEATPPSFWRDNGVGRVLGTAIGDIPAIFNDAHQNPLTGNLLSATELQNAKFLGFVNAVTLGATWELQALARASVAARAAAPAVQEGTAVFRVFGGEAKGLGQSWTTVNPGSVANFREAAGLFPGNTGRFLAEGRLLNGEGVLLRQARPGPGGVGGTIPELVIPNPGQQVCLLRVCGVNPGF